MATPKAIVKTHMEDNEAQQYRAPTVEPVTTEVRRQDTVAGQMADLNDSQYVRLHGEEAARQANSRGLINSLMAVTAGREAAIKAGLPIAQQDAETSAKTRFRNQEDQNRFLENRQSTNLNMEFDSHASQLRTREMGAESDLRRGEMGAESGLRREEMGVESGLRREEMTHEGGIVSDRLRLESELTREEVALEHRFNIERDTLSAENDRALAVLESSLQEGRIVLDAELRERLELKLQDQKLSDEVKLQILTTMTGIVRDTNAQIAEIGMTDRSAAAQAAAIRRLEEARDAQIEVYANLLDGFDDWNWGTDFVPTGSAGTFTDNTPDAVRNQRNMRTPIDPKKAMETYRNLRTKTPNYDSLKSDK